MHVNKYLFPFLICCIFHPGLYGQNRYGHLIEEQKNLPAEWLQSYQDKGTQKIYRGEELKTIGMPCGGIAAGQLYVRGDGTLAGWWIANNAYNTGYGIDHFMEFNTALGPWKVCYQTFEPFSYIEQGFNMVTGEGDQKISRPLNKTGFNDIRFIGEYPVAEVLYRDSIHPLPIDISLEVFSPFIPLNSKESALPATILQFTLTNPTGKVQHVELQGYQQNMVMLDMKHDIPGQSRNRAIRSPGMSSLYMDFTENITSPGHQAERIMFDDFESGNFDKWTVEGDAFAHGPAAVSNNSSDNLFTGNWMAHSGIPNSRGTGRLLSEEFTIREKFISFALKGFVRMDRARISLIVDGEVVERTSGNGTEETRRVNWDVSEYTGRKARIELHDLSDVPGHFIAVDDISFSNDPVWQKQDIKTHAHNGNMSLSLISDQGEILPDIRSNANSVPLGETLTGGVNCPVALQPGETREVTYLLTWYFPNRPAQLDGNNWNRPIRIEGEKIGNMYANWFSSSLDVARYVREHFSRLKGETNRFRQAYYRESTLPYWLLQRIMMPVSTLATETCQWWGTGKFYAWEGVGSCVGTCTHVWNYEQALARLFPDLEMNIREKTDFSISFREDGGIFTRNGGGNVHLDGQAGTILKSYREYLMSDNMLFLSRNWEKIKKATEYLILLDENEDGLIESQQRNTYDIAFMGANTYVGGLYLAALRASEKMSRLMGDEEFANHCKNIYTSGSRLSSEKLWNGEYFFQDVNLDKYPRNQYANGCLSDQLFGQTWAHMLQLGHIYPQDQVREALTSIWKYNWTMDVGVHNASFIPERFYAHDGEPGLINCTWPLSEHLRENAVRYRNEVWTGIEYQVATSMLYEGMITEGLSIVRAIHERYRPEKHNPWNEIECGDHYARGLASWGVLIALEDYFYDGNQSRLRFNPKIQQNDFNGFFTSARGWGNLSQKRTGGTQQNGIAVKWGELTLKELHVGIDFNPSAVTVLVNGEPLSCRFDTKNGKLSVFFEEITLLQNNKMMVLIKS